MTSISVLDIDAIFFQAYIDFANWKGCREDQ